MKYNIGYISEYVTLPKLNFPSDSLVQNLIISKGKTSLLEAYKGKKYNFDKLPDGVHKGTFRKQCIADEKGFFR